MSSSLRLEIIAIGEPVTLPVPTPAPGDDEYHGAPGDNNPILMDICQALEDHRVIRFLVSGFGVPDWQADVSADLEMVLEDLPEAIRRAGRGQGFTLGFHEQTLQRTLEFAPSGDHFTVSCRRWDDGSPSDAWTTEADAILMPMRDVRSLLERLADDFCRVAESTCPNLTGHRLYRAWRRAALRR